MYRKNENAILDFSKICRLCCSENAVMSVFRMKMNKKIMFCTNLQVWQNDGLPSQICKKCISKLHLSYQFKKLCETSDVRLRVYKEKYIDGNGSESEIEILEDDPVESNKGPINEVQQSVSTDMTLNVNQEFSYQDCIPLTDGRHYEPLQNITIGSSDIHYDSQLIFNGNNMLSTITPVNLTSQGQHTLIGSYSIPNLGANTSYQNNYSIQSLSQAQMITTGSMLNLENLSVTVQEENILRNNPQQYVQPTAVVAPVLDNKKDLKLSPNSSAFNKKRAQKLFYKKCIEENRCPVCSKIFNASGKLTRHMKIHGSKPFKCKVCKKGFSHMGNYRVHMRVHSDERPFACRICHMRCRQQQDLDKHLRTHTGERPHKCSTCQRAFTTSSNLVVHERIHSGEKPYVCSVCTKSFCQSNELTKHMRTHTGEKSHVCPVCSKGFNGSSTLIVHMRIHTGERPYVCTICNKGFTQSSGLAVHTRVHLSQSGYPCTRCPRIFPTEREMRKHVICHAPNNFRCSVVGCSRRFTRDHDLSRHLKMHENNPSSTSKRKK